jgi:hypothetical protein
VLEEEGKGRKKREAYEDWRRDKEFFLNKSR